MDKLVYSALNVRKCDHRRRCLGRAHYSDRSGEKVSQVYVIKSRHENIVFIAQESGPPQVGEIIVVFSYQAEMPRGWLQQSWGL